MWSLGSPAGELQPSFSLLATAFGLGEALAFTVGYLLQEVDLDPRGVHHGKQILEALTPHGYTGVFGKKKGSACDGLALFWRRDRVVEHGPAVVVPLADTVHVALEQPLLFDGVPVRVVCTHLKAGLNSEAEKTRSRQAEALCSRLGPADNIVLLGDLNAPCRDFHCLDESWQAPVAIPILKQHGLMSCYEAVQGEEPAYTSWAGWAHMEVRATFDYIMATAGVAPYRVLAMPDSTSILSSTLRTPTPEYPSDHFALVVDIAIGKLAKKFRPESA